MCDCIIISSYTAYRPLAAYLLVLLEAQRLNESQQRALFCLRLPFVAQLHSLAGVDFDGVLQLCPRLLALAALLCASCDPLLALRAFFANGIVRETKSQCVTHSFVTFTSNSVTKQRRVLFPGRLAFVYRVLRRRLPRASPC